jgi:hypothetical protein
MTDNDDKVCKDIKFYGALKVATEQLNQTFKQTILPIGAVKKCWI